MRTHELLWTSLAVMTLGAGLAIGCSNTQPMAEDDEEDEDTPALTNSSSSSSSGSTAPVETDAGVTDTDAGALLPVEDAGPMDPSFCTADSIPEAEVNDDATLANVIPGQSGSFCGGIATTGDVDHASFTLPMNVRSMGYGISFSRPGVDATLSINGQVFRLNQLIPVIPGGKYVLRVTGPQAMTYRFKLTVGL